MYDMTGIYGYICVVTIRFKFSRLLLIIINYTLVVMNFFCNNKLNKPINQFIRNIRICPETMLYIRL